jgi:26S proteasome regulatory subunit N1
MSPKDKDAIEITTPSGASTAAVPKKSILDDTAPTLSDEDKDLKERLETCVSTLVSTEASVTAPLRMVALDTIVRELREATSSMTSVPKPLKFLRPQFDTLKAYYASLIEASELRAHLADVLSVLAMTMGKHEERESLRFKLQAAKDEQAMSRTKDDNLGSWGHEYVRSLAGEIGQEYAQRVLDGADPKEDAAFADLLRMVYTIVPFHVTHNAEAEAVDLLIEVQRLKHLLLLESIDENNYQRICLYLIKTADFMADPDDWLVR